MYISNGAPLAILFAFWIAFTIIGVTVALTITYMTALWVILVALLSAVGLWCLVKEYRKLQ